MPVIAVVAAGAALWGGGAAAIGAVVAGTATLATTLTAVAAVGATLGAIGAVTGDKTLSTVGMVMGGVGGIGALAANAGVFGAAATTDSLFGSSSSVAAGSASADAAGGIGAATGSADAAGSVGTGAAAGTAASGQDIVKAISDFNSGISSPASSIAGGGTGDVSSMLPKEVSDAIGASSPTSGLDSIAPGTSGAAKTGGMINSSASAPTPTALAASSSPLAPTVTPGAVNAPTVHAGDISAPTLSAADVASGNPGFFSQLVSSPAGQLGLIQAGGSLISGLFDPLKPAQVDALNAQAAANRASTQLSLTQQANMAQPIPVANRNGGNGANVTGAPAGLINSQPGQQTGTPMAA